MAINEHLPFLLAIMGVAYACSVPESWQSQTVEERASRPDLVVYGTVISDHMLVRPDADLNQEYLVIVQPLCWLKRGPEVNIQDGSRKRRDHAEEPEHDGNDTDVNIQFENITVVEAAPCVFNNLTKGSKYILFLRKEDDGRFGIADFNVQSGALKEPTDDTIEAVHRGIDAGLRGRPHAECLVGVEIPCFVGEVDPKICNKGNALSAVLGLLIFGIALAVIGY